MEVKTQTVEQFLFEQLQKIAPGKYGIADVLQLFRSKLLFACSHLKGGNRLAGHKDYNFSIFTFPNGITEIKCLYNCGLKIRSDEKDLESAFKQLRDLPTSNTRASAEYIKPINPGPVPVYTDKDRQRIRESNDLFWKNLSQGIESGRIKPNDPILGGVFPHPDPVEAPDSVVERGIAQAYQRGKNKLPVLKAQVVVQDSVPALEPVNTKTKIRKSRKASKTKSRRRAG